MPIEAVVFLTLGFIALAKYTRNVFLNLGAVILLVYIAFESKEPFILLACIGVALFLIAMVIQEFKNSQ